MNSDYEKLDPLLSKPYVQPIENEKPATHNDIPQDIRPTTPTMEPHPIDFSAVPRGEAAYNHLIKNLNADEVNKKIEALEQKKEKVQALCKHFGAHSYYNPFFTLKPDTFPYYGLYAVKIGKLTMEQFSTLMIQWTLLKFQKDVRVCNLFTADGEVNPTARAYIQQTMKAPPPPPGDPQFMKKDAYMNDAQIDAFFERMRTLPKSEQQIFIFIDQQKAPTGTLADLTSLFSGQLSISQIIQTQRMFNVFSRYRENDNQMRMYPTAGMMRVAVETAFPENHVRIIPQIGLGSLEDIERDGKTHTRTLSVQFPGVVIKEADLLPTFDIDFMWHDFTHIWLASQIPDNHQKGLVRAGELVKGMIEKIPQEHQQVAQEFYERLIDMDNKVYQLNLGGTNNSNIDFVLALLMAFTDTRERLLIKKTREDLNGKTDDRDVVVKQVLANTEWSQKTELRTHLFEAFAQELYAHKHEFAQMGIDIKQGLFAEYDEKRTRFLNGYGSRGTMDAFKKAFQ